jgi:predicted ABC-type ATPase
LRQNRWAQPCPFWRLGGKSFSAVQARAAPRSSTSSETAITFAGLFFYHFALVFTGRSERTMLRVLYLMNGVVITETVFSHPSKVDLATRATALGYLVHLHVVMVPVEVTLLRVEHRVRHGGHDVPPAKVRTRYERLWPLIAEARAIVDRATFYDNENDTRPYRTVAVYERGRPIGQPDWPDWTPASLRT